MQQAGALESPQALQAFFAKIGEPLSLEEAGSMLQCAHLYHTHSSTDAEDTDSAQLVV